MLRRHNVSYLPTVVRSPKQSSLKRKSLSCTVGYQTGVPRAAREGSLGHLRKWSSTHRVAFKLPCGTVPRGEQDMEEITDRLASVG